jgi:integrase
MPARKPTPVTVSNDNHEIKIYTTESHGRPLYQLSYYRGGKRERRSFADINEAKREARIILGEMARNSIQAENLTAAEIESYTIARRVLAPHNVPVHVAAETFAAVCEQLPADVSVHDAVRYFNQFNRGVERKQINDLIEEYASARRASGVSQAYLSLVTRYITGFGRFTAGRMLPDLRARDVDDFLRAIPWEPITKNDARYKIVAFANWAKNRGFLPRDWNEFDGAMEYIEPVKEVTIFTPEEMERVLLTMGKHLATPFVAIGAFAGLRTAEITRLDWKNVNFERGFIEVRADTCKTRARRLVPISDNLRAWLQPFAVPSGPVVVTPQSISSVVTRNADIAGVKWKRNALRHSFVSYRLASTNDPARTALEAGHDQTMLFKFYREVVTPEMGAKWFAIMPPPGFEHVKLKKRAYHTTPRGEMPRRSPSAIYSLTPQLANP